MSAPNQRGHESVAGGPEGRPHPAPTRPGRESFASAPPANQTYAPFWRRWPIRLRIALVYAGLAVATVGLLSLIVFMVARSALYDALDTHLHRDLELTLTALDLGEPPRLRPFMHASAAPNDPDPMLQLWQAGTLRIAHPPVAHPLAGLPPPQSGAAPYYTVREGGRTLRVHELAVHHAPPGTVLRVARDEQALAGQLQRLLGQLFALALGAVGVGVALAFWAGKRALLPLVGIAAQLRSLGPAHLQRRLAVPPTGDEAAALAESHNAMLDRIESGYRDAERFAALVAHELRTPLASLRAGAEVALSAPGPRDSQRLAETLRATLEESDRMTQFVNRLLLLARPGGRMHSQRFDLVALLREVAELLQPLAEDGGQRIQAAPAEPLFVDADRVVVSQMVMDMIDNSVRHAGAGATVWLAAEVDPDRVRIRIDDDGCGLPLDGAPRGSGLGMELNRRMATMLDGRIEWTERPGGGTRVQIELPR